MEFCAQSCNRPGLIFLSKAGLILPSAAARNQCGLEHWTPHDLRRTAATHMNRLGINFIWVEKVLNHKLQGMLKVYNKHPYEDEKRAALDQWAAELRRIIAGESNVVALGDKHAANLTAA